MILNLFLQAVFQLLDTSYRLGVRLLYHSRVVGIILAFYLMTFLISCHFCFSIVNEKTFKDVSGFYAIDVGQGDSLLYVTNNHQVVLIDTGKPGSGIVGKMENILGRYRKKIDFLILTHPDSDHVGEVDNILSVYNVGVILYSPIYDVREDSKKLIDGIKNDRKNKLTIPIFAGSNIYFSNHESMYFLSPSFSGMNTFISKKEIEEDNFFSVVSIIKNRDLIFAMADAPKRIEKVISGESGVFDNLQNFVGENINRGDFERVILKAGHHGSKTSSDDFFVKSIYPTDVVLSYGKKNRYGHPHAEVLNIFSSFKNKIHRTIFGTMYFSE